MNYSINRQSSSLFFTNTKALARKLVSHPERLIVLWNALVHAGPLGLMRKVQQLVFYQSINSQYQPWLKNHTPSANELDRQKRQSKRFSYRPVISIITPTYNTPLPFLAACIQSVLNQTYDRFALCLADDASTDPEVRKLIKHYADIDHRIKYVFRPRNGHICRASNSALALASGAYIGLLDHDDILAPDALYEVVKAFQADKKIDIVYTDEDKVESSGTGNVDPFFKPDWSPDYLRSVDYITHFTVIRKSLIDRVGGFRTGFEGAQDWDLLLRTTVLTNHIHHIPKILYHWRKSEHSTASAKYGAKDKPYASMSQQKALNADLQNRGYKGNVQETEFTGVWRMQYAIAQSPKVSIIIPTKDQPILITKCLTSILQKTTYKNYEIIIVDTGSTDEQVWQLYDKLRKQFPALRIVQWDKPFNFSSVCNFGVGVSTGDHLLFVNNDTEVISPGWIEAMLEHSQRPGIGAVGAQLLYPNKTIQHLGGILGLPKTPKGYGIAGLAYNGNHAQFLHIDRLSVKNYSFVTGACLMVAKQKFHHIGGFDERLAIAWNDIDLCLRLLTKLGLYTVLTPHASLIHYESQSISKPHTKGRNMKQFAQETRLFLSRWDTLRKHDPFYNPNFSRGSGGFNQLAP